MEHRCSTRRMVDLEVALNYRNVELIRGRTRDISLGGMFVETVRQGLPKNSLVRFSVRLPSGKGWLKECKAMVVHSASGGVGLMFTELDDASDACLHQVMAWSRVADDQDLIESAVARPPRVHAPGRALRSAP